MLRTRKFVATALLFLPFTLHASFIESTIGAAVVNDATAAYYNPAALTILSNPQIITLGSIAYFQTHFSGQLTQANTGLVLSGVSKSNTHYYLPSLYAGTKVNDKIAIGMAIISNSFNRDFDQDSIFRYIQSNNSLRDIDFVPAIGVKLNDSFAIGAAIILSRVHMLTQPISGIPSLNIPDSQSRNETTGNGKGFDFGFFYKASSSTQIGFNYRSAVTYSMNGKSIFQGPPTLISNHYGFTLWTPARSVVSINQFVTKTLGWIATVQYIQWSIFNNLNVHGIATRIGTQTLIVPHATIPFHFHDSWIFTGGIHYRATPKFIIRVATSYLQSPSNGNYQISNGDSIVLGSSIAYEFNKNFTLDGSYAHAFIQNQNIHIVNNRSTVTGINKASRDALSLKLTFNIMPVSD